MPLRSNGFRAGRPQGDDGGHAVALGDGPGGARWVGRRLTQMPGGLAGLLLVHDQDVERAQGLGRKRAGRRVVEQDPRAGAARQRRRRPVLRLGHLHLEQQQVARARRCARQLPGLGLQVGPTGHHDGVLAGGVHHDAGAAGGGFARGDRGEVHAALAQGGERGLREAVAADAADHTNPGARARGGQRLVRPLAARNPSVRAGRDRLARRRKPLHGEDQIDVDRAEYDDHRARPPCPCPVAPNSGRG